MIYGQARVFFADDHEMIIQALVSHLGNNHHLSYAGKALNSKELFQRIENAKADILFLDVLETETVLIEQIKKLKEICPAMHIVVLTVRENIHTAQRAIEAGAIGYIGKSVSSKEFLDAIDSIRRGQMVIRVKALDPEDEMLEAFRNALSDRETEVTCLIAKGLSSRQIAKCLKRKEYTIEEHRKNIFKKVKEYGVNNAASLAYRAAESNLCEGLP